MMTAMRNRETSSEREVLIRTCIRDFRFVKRAENESDSGPGTLEGYAAVWDEETDLGYMLEEFARGCFKDSIANEDDDQLALMNHNPDMVLGRMSAGTLKLAEDAKGLKAEIDLPGTSYAKDIHASVTRGDVKGMSVGFRIKREEYIRGDGPDQKDKFRVTEAQLVEVSPAGMPAYEGTSLEARTQDRRMKSVSEADQEQKQKSSESATIVAKRKRKRQEQRVRVLRLAAGARARKNQGRAVAA